MIRYTLVHTDLSPRKFLSDKVKSMGLKKVGSGAFAAVYSKGGSSKVVYKMAVMEDDNYRGNWGGGNCSCAQCRRYRNYDSYDSQRTPRSDPERALKDDGYFNYLETVVLKNQDNPLMPKIKDVEVIGLIDDAGETRLVYIVKMERLKPFDRLKSDSQIKLLWRFGLSSVYDIENEMKAVLIRDQTNQWKGIVKPLRALFNRRNADLHDGNVMVRGSGRNMQLVLTDPVT